MGLEQSDFIFKFDHFIKVKLFSFTHPQWHLVFGFNKPKDMG
jgi:hypothetical protein